MVVLNGQVKFFLFSTSNFFWQFATRRRFVIFKIGFPDKYLRAETVAVFHVLSRISRLPEAISSATPRYWLSCFHPYFHPDLALSAFLGQQETRVAEFSSDVHFGQR